MMKARRPARTLLWVEELETRLVPSTTLITSTNWSGYAVNTTAGAVSDVRGSWNVQKVSHTNSGYSSFWVGIDGFSSSTVEQIGTDSDYVGGREYYYAWYEMYPAGSVTITKDNLGNAFSITPGDTINAEVSSSGSDFNLSITDASTSQTFSTTQTLTSAKRSSAEWIAEAPSSGSILPLANFGTVNFTGSNATINGTSGSISSFNNYQINMTTRSGALKDQTSSLDTTTGTSFSVTFKSSGVSTGGGGGHGHGSHSSAADLTPVQLPGFDINRATPANPATLAQQTPAFFNSQAFLANAARQDIGAIAASRFGYSGSDEDLLDVAVPGQNMPEGPAPGAQPMPNRNQQPAPAPMPMPMPMQMPPVGQDMPTRLEVTPAIVDTESAAPAASPAGESRAANVLRSLVNLIGGVGAFALFGNVANRSDYPAKDKQKRARWF
jgi:hypothetical protein